ncbi:MAG: TatD family hydrolase [bacterium]|nr:TatD family hydrolase [bacterium]
MQIIDSHCHIHDPDFPLEMVEVFENMQNAEISKAICIGVDLENSRQAVKFAERYSGEIELFAAVGVHPHEAAKHDLAQTIAELEKLAQSPKVVAIGEIGLDYFYQNSPAAVQQDFLRAQLKLAQKLDLPVSFHVREAFDDFWPIFDEVAQNGKIRGVLHSFTDSRKNLQKGLERGLSIGINGISTFAKKPEELAMFAEIPLEKTLLETDAPFLAPKSKRGKPNQPAFVRLVAEDLAKKREKSLAEIAEITSQNTENLFEI